MARRPRATTLAVYMNGRRVGRLRREPSGAVDFTYADDWLAWNHAIPVSHSLPLREDRYVGGQVTNVFDNLLPDNQDIRARLAAKVGAQGADAYSLLEALGRDCVGALQFLPEDAAAPTASAVDGEPLSDEGVEQILRNLARAPLGVEGDAAFRISLAGAQEKTALLFHEGQWLKPLGPTPTTHILKPQIGRINDIDLTQSVENEHFCLTLLAAFGLPTAKTQIHIFGGTRALVVERFDRRWTKAGRLIRVPQEDFCQALSVPWTLKYQSDGGPGIVEGLDLLAASDEPRLDRRRFLEAQMLFWLLGATDGHAKNFSVFLQPGGGFRLTPLYDVLSTQPSLDRGQIRRNQMRLAMAVGDARHYRVDEVTPRHFMQTAAAAGLDETLVTELFAGLNQRTPTAIAQTLAALPEGFPAALAQSVVNGFQARLGLADRAVNL